MAIQAQLPLGDPKAEYHRLKALRLDLTARQRNQEETVDTLAGMLRKERKILKAILKEKREAEDAEELHRCTHDLEI